MKRIASLVLALALCASLAVPALAAEFSDVPVGHAFYGGISYCAENGIVGGYSDGTFQPGRTVTRSNFSVMLSRAFFADEVKKYDTDAYKAVWFGPNTKALSMAGVLRNTSFQYGFGDASIMDQTISRYDMAQLMTNIMTKQGFAAGEAEKAAAVSRITDYSSIPSQYRDAVANVYALGIIGGYSDGTFGGTVTMNRGQAAVVIYRMMQYSGNSGTEVPVPIPEAPAAPTPSEPNASSTPSQAASTLADGSAITEANVLAMIQELLQKYPKGMAWPSGTARTGTASNTMVSVSSQYKQAGYGVSTSMQTGCGGFASLVSDSIFGSGDANPARKVPVEYVRPGDVIIILNADGKLTHVATAASRITGLSEYSTDKTIPVLTIYDGNANGKVRYNDYYLVPKTYNTTAGYYVEVWTRYPTDGTAWNGSSGSNSNNSGSTGSSSTTPSTAPSTTPSTGRTCDLCGNSSTNWFWSADRSKHICSSCYATPSGKAFVA